MLPVRVDVLVVALRARVRPLEPIRIVRTVMGGVAPPPDVRTGVIVSDIETVSVMTLPTTND